MELVFCQTRVDPLWRFEASLQKYGCSAAWSAAHSSLPASPLTPYPFGDSTPLRVLMFTFILDHWCGYLLVMVPVTVCTLYAIRPQNDYDESPSWVLNEGMQEVTDCEYAITADLWLANGAHLRTGFMSFL